MVERESKRSDRVESRPLDEINMDQLVHIKAFQDGYLIYNRKKKSVPGTLWGQN